MQTNSQKTADLFTFPKEFLNKRTFWTVLPAELTLTLALKNKSSNQEDRQIMTQTYTVEEWLANTGFCKQKMLFLLFHLPDQTLETLLIFQDIYKDKFPTHKYSNFICLPLTLPSSSPSPSITTPTHAHNPHIKWLLLNLFWFITDDLLNPYFL